MYQLAQGIMNGFLGRSWTITIPVKAVGSPSCNQTWKSSNHSLTSKSKSITSISGTSRNSPEICSKMIQNVDFMWISWGVLSLNDLKILPASFSQWLLSILFPFRLTSISARRPWNSSQASTCRMARRKITGQKMEEKYGTLLGFRADL